MEGFSVVGILVIGIGFQGWKGGAYLGRLEQPELADCNPSSVFSLPSGLVLTVSITDTMKSTWSQPSGKYT